MSTKPKLSKLSWLVIVAVIMWSGLGLSGSLYFGEGDARLYVLSTIAQTIGAMFGLSLTIVLVGVQVGVQYAPASTVFRLLGRDPAVLSALGVNCFTILYALLLLPNENLIPVSTAWQARVDESVAMSLFVLSIATLPTALGQCLKMITPAGLAKHYLQEITARKLAESVPSFMSLKAQLLDNLNPEERQGDPLILIADLIYGELSKDHFVAANQIVEMQVKRVQVLLQELRQGKEFERKSLLLIDHVLSHLLQIVQRLEPARQRALRVPLGDLHTALTVHELSGKVSLEVAHVRLLQLGAKFPATLDGQLYEFLIDAGPDYLVARQQAPAKLVVEILEKRGMAEEARKDLASVAARLGDDADQVADFLALLPSTKQADRFRRGRRRS